MKLNNWIWVEICVFFNLSKIICCKLSYPGNVFGITQGNRPPKYMKYSLNAATSKISDRNLRPAFGYPCKVQQLENNHNQLANTWQHDFKVPWFTISIVGNVQDEWKSFDQITMQKKEHYTSKYLLLESDLASTNINGNRWQLTLPVEMFLVKQNMSHHDPIWSPRSKTKGVTPSWVAYSSAPRPWSLTTSRFLTYLPVLFLKFKMDITTSRATWSSPWSFATFCVALTAAWHKETSCGNFSWTTALTMVQVAPFLMASLMCFQRHHDEIIIYLCIGRQSWRMATDQLV